MPVDNYPALTRLLPLDKIPPNLGFIQNGISSVSDKIFVKNLQVNKSPDGATARYNLTLVLYEKVGLEVPGTNGLALVLNPGEQQGTTEIKVSFSYAWEILRFLNGFDLQNFSFSPRAFFDLFLDIVGMDEQELIQEVIEVFIQDADPVTKFITDLEGYYSIAIDPPSAANVHKFRQQVFVDIGRRRRINRDGIITLEIRNEFGHRVGILNKD
ncbi:MAG: hypothetical protein AAF570_22830, partial [Bacteroidota bacterium]